MQRNWILAITLALACVGPDEEDGETQAGTEAEGDGDGDPTGDGDGDQGVCYSLYDRFQQINCNFDQPCPTVEFNSDPNCENPATFDPVAAACIVDALAAGTQADHRISDCPGGIVTESWRLQVFGDGTVLWNESEYQDLTGSRHTTWRAMPDAAYFQGCQTDTPEQLLDCVRGILDQECQLGEPVCP